MTDDVKEPGAWRGKNVTGLCVAALLRHPLLGCALRFGLSAAFVSAGIGAWLILRLVAGSPMPAFITLYPAVMAAAVLAGLGPGLLATGLAAWAAAYWILPPEGFAVSSFADRLALGLFTGISLVINVLAEGCRRNRRPVALLANGSRRYTALRDITALTQTEAALKAANDELDAKVQERADALKEANSYNRNLLEANLDPLVTIGPDGEITDVNAATESVTGRSRSELIGTDFLNYFTDPEQARAGYTKAFEEGLVRNYPLEILHRDGHTVPVMYNATVYRDESGKVIGVFADARDITEQKRAEAALKAERERLYAVLETLPVYVVLLAKDYRVHFANRYFREHFGESGGSRCFEYLFNRTEPCENCESFKVFSTQSYHNWQWTGPDGRNYDIHDYPFTDHDGSPLVLEMGIDVTVAKQAQAKLREVNETLEQRVAERTAQLGTANEELQREVAERKRTGEILRTSEAKYRSLFENMAEGFAINELLYDEQGRPCDWRVQEINDAFTRHTGVERQRIVGQRMGELFPDAVQEYLPLFSSVVESQKPVYFDTHSTYVSRHLHIVAYPAGGRFFASIVEDISARKQAQMERDTSILFLRMVNTGRNCDELLKAAIRFIKDHAGCDAVGIRLKKDGDFPYQETLGFSTGFLEAENSLCTRGTAGESCLTACMCGQVISGTWAFDELSLTAHGSFFSNDTAELLHLPSDPHNPIRGRCIREGYGSIALLPLYDGQERMGLLQLNARRTGAFTPETLLFWERLADHLSVAVAKLQAEESLKESEERYRSLFQNVQEGFYLAKPLFDGDICRDAVYLDVNPAFARLMRLPREQIIGRRMKELVPLVQAEWLEAFGKVARSGEPGRHQGYSETFHKHFEAFVFRPSPGKFAVLVSDITPRKQFEHALTRMNAQLERRVAERTEELAKTNRELEAFCYSVSHDLRAPLRSMDGFSQALLEDYGTRLDTEGQDFLHRIRSNSQRMARLIDDLLQLSRLTRSQMQLQKVDLSALAQAAIADLRQSDPSRDVDVRIAPGLTATGDPVLLRTALTNLLQNAWKFTGQRPDAVIEVGSVAGNQRSEAGALTDVDDSPSPVFFVRDNGVGFDMRYADKLFTPFQRLHAITEFPGTGIGLATVQRVLHRHGGRIWVEAAPGSGATFYFTIGGPLSSPRTAGVNA